MLDVCIARRLTAVIIVTSLTLIKRTGAFPLRHRAFIPAAAASAGPTIDRDWGTGVRGLKMTAKGKEGMKTKRGGQRAVTASGGKQRGHLLSSPTVRTKGSDGDDSNMNRDEGLPRLIVMDLDNTLW